MSEFGEALLAVTVLSLLGLLWFGVLYLLGSILYFFHTVLNMSKLAAEFTAVILVTGVMSLPVLYILFVWEEE